MKPHTIMIADDDPALVQMLASRCKQLGLDVVRSPDAMHALLGAHRLKPDLILLDINMPGGNGLSVSEMIATDPQLTHTPVIVMTGDAHEGIDRRCRAIGAHLVRKGSSFWERLQGVICELLHVEAAAAPGPLAAESTEPPPELAATPEAHPDPAARDAQRPTVLCIDDDPDISKIIKLRLEPYGVEVARAFSGMQGFWTALDCKPNVIICDLNMPDGEGNYLNARFKSHSVTKDIPVIVLTGQDNPGLMRQMFSAGVAAYLRKPLDVDELLRELRQYVSLPEVPGQGGHTSRGPTKYAC